MGRIAGLVLAAGSGQRMGRPKGTLTVDGERLVDRAVRVLREGGCDPVVAVVRAGVEVPAAVVVVNPDPERGLRSSLELGVAAAGESAAVAVLLADLPGVGVAAVRAVVAGWRPGRIAVGTYAGRWGHPVVTDPVTWRAALQAAGPDAGARALLRERPQDVDEIAVDGDPTDLDTPEDLARWRSG